MNLKPTELLQAFVYGWRFDLSVLAAGVGFCFLALPWLTKKPLARRLWFYLFIGLNSVFFLINIVDVELFNFTAKRFTSSSFFLMNDAHFSNLVTPYLPLAGISFLILGFYVFTAQWLAGRFTFQGGVKKKALVSFAVLIVSVVFSRGGFQLKPLTFVDAKIFSDTYANNLVLNSTFTLLKSATKTSLQRTRHYEQAELLGLLNPQEIPAVNVTIEKPNIVLLILESFSEEYSQLKNPEVMPYFNRLRRESVDFRRAYANGRRSIEGIAALISGIPALMEEPFINSEFSANQVIGLGNILGAHNYHTSFFHGTNLGSMHFDSFVKSVGIKHHYSQADFPGKDDFDGTWGIFDEAYLKWTCDQLTRFPPPFFSAIFTLSSHQPYRIPEQYKERFKDNRLEIMKGIQYSDYSLGQFMNCARQQPWYNNTIFILTADHTGPALTESAEFEERYRVPLLLYSPQERLLQEVNPDQLAQHIDVLPTILDLVKIENKNKNHLARSLLRAGPKFVALYSDGQYKLVGDVRDGPAQLKAVQQYFSEGLYDNRLYYPAK